MEEKNKKVLRIRKEGIVMIDQLSYIVEQFKYQVLINKLK